MAGGIWPSREEGSAKAREVLELRARYEALRPHLRREVKRLTWLLNQGLADHYERDSAKKDLEFLDNAIAEIPTVVEEMQQLGTVKTAGTWGRARAKRLQAEED